jgi:hypothetical protein
LAAADAATVLQRISSQRALRLLNDAGYTDAKVDQDDDIVAKFGSETVLVLVGSEKNTVMKFRYTTSRKAALSLLNEWNRKRKFTKAYVDQDGDTTLEMDLDFAGGITEARVVDAVRTFAQSLDLFKKELFDPKSSPSSR